MSQISVIIPVYNVEKYLPVCVESVMAQTFENIEVILVDDGSMDSSPEICDRYAAADERISVIHKSNGGLASARQAGFERAEGDYIFCVDSDDCIHPDTLAALYKVALNTGADIVQCDLRVIEEEAMASAYELHEKGIHTLSPYQAYCVVEKNDESLGHNSRLATTVTWGKLIKAETLQKVIPIENVRVHEDQMLISRLLSVINQLIFVETDYYYYRNRKGSIMKSSWNASKLVMVDIYLERITCVENANNIPKEQKELLLNIIYRQYMFSIVRNSVLTSKNLKGDEKTATLRMLHSRFKEAYVAHNKDDLSQKDRLFLCVFYHNRSVGRLIYSLFKGREL